MSLQLGKGVELLYLDEYSMRPFKSLAIANTRTQTLSGVCVRIMINASVFANYLVTRITLSVVVSLLSQNFAPSDMSRKDRNYIPFFKIFDEH